MWSSPMKAIISTFGVDAKHLDHSDLARQTWFVCLYQVSSSYTAYTLYIGKLRSLTYLCLLLNYMSKSLLMYKRKWSSNIFTRCFLLLSVTKNQELVFFLKLFALLIVYYLERNICILEKKGTSVLFCKVKVHCVTMAPFCFITHWAFYHTRIKPT